MKSQIKTFKTLFYLIFCVQFLSGCFFRAQINDLDNLSSVKNNPSTSPETTTPSAPTPSPPSGLLVTLSAPSFAKIDSSATYTINLSEAQSTDVTINYETQDSTAVSPQHYISTKGSVIITAGNTSATFNVFTTNKSDSIGSFKDFISRLTSTSLGTLSGSDKTTAVGMHQLSNVTSLISQSETLCAIDSSGYAWFWGTYTSSKSAQKLPELNFLASMISIGWNHKCALTLSGGVKCWGANFAGNLGDGTNTDSYTTPVDVVGLGSGVNTIVSGINHTCALLNTGGVKCWGYNAHGQLGNSSTTDSNVPVDVTGLTSGVSKIYAGGNFNCAILSTGSGVKCWGENTNGQLGDNTLVNKSAPVDVLGLTSGVLDMAQSIDSTCAVTSSNALKCWGNNLSGQLGDGTQTSRSAPTNVSGLSSNVTKVSIYRSHACALLNTGSVKCWGENTFGELGDSSFNQSLTPVTASNLGNSAQILDIKLSLNSTCILKTDNHVYCIGNNIYGNLGDGNPTVSLKIPTKVFNSGASIIAGTKGESHTCYINSSNGVECWGYNYYGQVGDNTNSSRAVPTAVTGLSSGVTAISAGRYHTCALLTAGDVKCWGQNSSGQLGDNTTINRKTPVSVSGLTNVIAISAGRYHTCALINTGGMKCWGDNSYGQLGDNTNTSRTTPVDVVSLGLSVSSFASGYNHTCAVMSDSTIKCWGNNDEGELGDGTTTRSKVPVVVSGIPSGATKVSGAQFATCAVVSQSVKCWGANYSGELGDNTWNQSSLPVNVIGAESNIVDIMASGYDYSDYACALTSAGGMKCWGDNGYYQLGNESFDRFGNETAKDVFGLKSGVSKLVPGEGVQNCIIGTDGYMKCFGYNDDYNKAGNVIHFSPQSVLVAHEDL